MRSSATVSVPRAIFWLGLAWVWSSGLWLFGVAGLIWAGLPLGAAAMALHMLGSLAIGLGLCATERWGWAPALCLCAVYAGAGLATALAAGWTQLNLPPGTLSWTPVLLGLTSAQTGRLGAAGILVAIPGIVGTHLLWREQEHFDVPYRRTFTILVRYGILPTLFMLLVDLYLVYGWWRLQVG